MAFINPSNPALGARRQDATAMSIQEQLEEMARRKKSMSRFAQTGTQRALPRARRPMRGPGVGVRYGAGGGRPGGGLTTTINDRIGGPGGRGPIDPPNRPEMPRVGPPPPKPRPLEEGVFHPELGGMGAGLLDQGETAASPGGMTNADFLQPGEVDTLQSPWQPDAPQSIEFGGLVPLGDGRWMNPITGEIFGGGGAPPPPADIGGSDPNARPPGGGFGYY